MFDVSCDIMLKVVEQPEVRHVERLIADRIRPNRWIMKDSSSIQSRTEMHERRAILALPILGLVGRPWSWRWLLNHKRAGEGSPTAFSAAWAGFVAFDVPRLALSTAPPCLLMELAHLRRGCFSFHRGLSHTHCLWFVMNCCSGEIRLESADWGNQKRKSSVSAGV